MSELRFHKCVICGKLFYNNRRHTYCLDCFPKNKPSVNKIRINDLSDIKDRAERRRAWDRMRWHHRMEDPAFKERERLRQLEKYYRRKQENK